MTTNYRNAARRALIASTVGTTIEWYDFYIYGLVAALVFGKIFFPTFDPYAGTLLAFSTYFVGFASRPIGAALFGHFGDRIGRKTTLVATLLLMGISTALVGLIPNYHAIGIWGAVLVTLLRVVQGIGVGGEWAGSVALATEWSRFDRRRGLAGSWPQVGSPLGLLLALVVLLAIDVLGGANGAFLVWGWRIPFIASLVLVGVGLWIRLGVEETSTFDELVSKKARVEAPVTVALRDHWRAIVLTCLIRTGQQSAFFLFTTFLLSYGTKTLGLPQRTLLIDLVIAGCVSLFTTPGFGALSDRIGRRRTYVFAALAMALWAVPYYLLIDTALPPMVLIATVLGFAIHDAQYGPQAAFTAEAFPPEVRYSGASIGYQLASLTAGGPAPLIATFLLHQFHSGVAVGVYLTIAALIGATAASLLPERSRREYVHVPDDALAETA